LSASPETIKERIRALIINPRLRKSLGTAGRAYVEKYHSEKNMLYWFGKLYDKIIKGEQVDLMYLYHPLLPDSYNNMSPKVVHPLVENRIPDQVQMQGMID